MKKESILNVYRDGIGALCKGKGLPFICSLASEKLKHPVMITDAALKILVYQDVTNSDKKLDSFFSEDLIHEYKNKNLFFPLYCGNPVRNIGNLIILSEKPLEKKYEPLLDAFVQLACLTLMHEKTMITIEKKFMGEFIGDILHNNINSKSALIRRGQRWGWDFIDEYRVIVIQPDLKDIRNIRKPKIDQLNSVAEFFIEENSEEDVITAPFEDQLIVLWPKKKNNKKDKDILTKKLIEFKQFCEKKLQFPVIIGSGQFAEPMELYKSFQEAKTAIHVTRSYDEDRSIIFFEDLGIMRMLISVGDYKVESFVNEYLAPLLKDNGERELIHTLEAYFANNEDCQKTAKSLYIHTNTLRYRLSKIEELLGIDLADTEAKLNLYTALKLHKLKG